MTFKEIFDKQIIVEDHIRKGLKLIYEINLELFKPKQEAPLEEPAAQQQQQNPVQQQQEPINPAQQQPEQAHQPTQQLQGEPTQDLSQSQQDLTHGFDINSFASVMTEEENDEKIERKLNGEIKLNDSQKDNVQSFDDLLEVVSNINKGGNKVFDDFCIEVITLCANQNFNELKNKIDKKSKIFVEIYYGYNKQDSVGVRFSKRPMSDILTSTMLVDNEIVSAKFDINRVNQQIVEFRNYEANK